MKLLRKILFPLVPVYYTVTSVRNKLYDLGFKKSKSYDFPVICVGNLSVGGTGKTPMIEYLIKLLKNDYKIATLSRGYKRKSEGFQLADENSTVEILGDEPFQFYTKFGNVIQVAVDANRQAGISKLRILENGVEIVLLDDAFQHRKVNAGFNILLTTYNNIYTNDFVLPTGNLREPKSGAKRANIIVVTKCPETLDISKKTELIKQINPEKHQAVFFSSIAYAEEVISLNAKRTIDTLNNFTLVTGIANPKPLISFLKSKGLSFEHLNFKDHHEFSKEDILKLENKGVIVTTEKDFMRLKHYKSLQSALYYLPITMVIDDSLKFNELIKSFVKNN
ncbi:tetraacyldisaccharide 4'-kinase [Pseudalgibacter alginicilyticus]|uniref:Tetraacyldisaccharide 4'-kinase n=1 Tax=Pseudalgibacter alginicilyticus TaxID=1736674 RepID=A0A0N7HYV5_9FLAO|nr:tetraacyldisaccharide 4'-kinase [Pseudalgibacter alginicilyticus]ALJ06310.1 tetraacyldisaccharide 4'-kinase [Pseudalgibacter alginicilyticus]